MLLLSNGSLSPFTTLPASFCRWVRSQPRRPCLMYGDHSASYEEMGRAVRSCVQEVSSRLGGSIRSHPLAGLRLGRTPEYVVAYLSLACLGLPVVPFDEDSPSAEVREEMRSLGIAVMLTHDPDDRIPGSETIAIRRAEPSGGTFPWGDGEGVPPEARTADEVTAETPLVLLRTSGSTSHPKRVVLTHHNVLSSGRAHRRSVGQEGGDVSLAALPLSFGYCNTTQLVSQMDAGGTLALLPGTFMPSAFARAVRMSGATTTTLVPSMLALLATWPGLGPDELPTLRSIVFGGAPPDETVLQVVHDRLPDVELIQTYGQTEAGPRITTLRAADSRRKPGAAGKAVPGVRIAIAGPDGRHLPAGETGQVIVHGPGVMCGYHKDPAGTSEVLRNGWLHTGDLGRLDNDDFLWITGRMRNLIITAGKNVVPEEVEAHLCHMPGIAEAAVFGVPDRFRGEAVHALLIADGEEQPSVEKIRSFLGALVAGYKIPRRISFVQDLPRTRTGKISRGELSTYEEGFRRNDR
ncbi:class I adenylate-forming enzyme family protein [Streptomyces asiaticus]|uniref:class I adenylate-forming enzyme family protein n=1 Tax=Streptomyces asiaticus TaxID=114695 RepID=UPI0037F162FB